MDGGRAELMEMDCRFSVRQAGWVDGGRAEVMERDCRFPTEGGVLHRKSVTTTSERTSWRRGIADLVGGGRGGWTGTGQS